MFAKSNLFNITPKTIQYFICLKNLYFKLSIFLKLRKLKLFPLKTLLIFFNNIIKDYFFMLKKRNRPPSLQTKKVLFEFFKDGSDWKYGYSIIATTGYSSGLIYPMLARLEKNGFLESEREVLASDATRPARRMYRLTEKGKTLTLDLLNSVLDNQSNQSSEKSNLGTPIPTT